MPKEKDDTEIRFFCRTCMKQSNFYKIKSESLDVIAAEVAQIFFFFMIGHKALVGGLQA